MKRIFALLLAAVSLISLPACAQPEVKTLSKYQLAAPQYPQMAPNPDETRFSWPNGDFDSGGFNQVYDAWQADRRKQTDQPEGYTDVLDGYLRAAIPQLLPGTSGENKVCSPINLYMALAMLAEVTDGESREQMDTAREILKEKGVTYHNISPDPEGDFYKDFVADISTYPTTYIVDGEGIIVGAEIVGNVKKQLDTVETRLALITGQK